MPQFTSSTSLCPAVNIPSTYRTQWFQSQSWMLYPWSQAYCQTHPCFLVCCQSRGQYPLTWRQILQACYQTGHQTAGCSADRIHQILWKSRSQWKAEMWSRRDRQCRWPGWWKPRTDLQAEKGRLKDEALVLGRYFLLRGPYHVKFQEPKANFGGPPS